MKADARFQRYVNVTPLPGVQVPRLQVSTLPTRVTPMILGLIVLRGVVGGAVVPPPVPPPPAGAAFVVKVRTAEQSSIPAVSGTSKHAAQW